MTRGDAWTSRYKTNLDSKVCNSFVWLFIVVLGHWVQEKAYHRSLIPSSELSSFPHNKLAASFITRYFAYGTVPDMGKTDTGTSTFQSEPWYSDLYYTALNKLPTYKVKEDIC